MGQALYTAVKRMGKALPLIFNNLVGDKHFNCHEVLYWSGKHNKFYRILEKTFTSILTLVLNTK